MVRQEQRIATKSIRERVTANLFIVTQASNIPKLLKNWSSFSTVSLGQYLSSLQEHDNQKAPEQYGANEVQSATSLSIEIYV